MRSVVKLSTPSWNWSRSRPRSNRHRPRDGTSIAQKHRCSGSQVVKKPPDRVSHLSLKRHRDCVPLLYVGAVTDRVRVAAGRPGVLSPVAAWSTGS
jgi:hypothetical protein